METIKASEKALRDVFCDQYIFHIPPYQRPYSWGTDHVAELLDDLLWASGSEPPEERPPYFLGSIVVIKDPNHAKADVVDGQQRLITLTILMSVLRELAETEDERRDIDKYLRQKGSAVEGTKDVPRLSVRKRDAEFFRKTIQEGVDADIIDTADSDARSRMIDNRDFLRTKLKDMSVEERGCLLPFAVRRCYLVVVEASDQTSAYRIFSVMNDRGLDLSPTDILKSDIIGAISGEQQQIKYNDIWEALEDGLGRATFRDLFAHLRMIHRKQKMRNALEREFHEYVDPAHAPEKFIDDELRPSAEVFKRILNPDPTKLRRYRLLRGLAQLDNQDWQPPAIAFHVKYYGEDDDIDEFLNRLDRLAFYLFIVRANINDRLHRYGAVLTEIDKGAALQAGSSLELTEDEKQALLRMLDGEIYLNQRTRRPILLRLDGMLTDATAYYDYKVITIEHVLPQNPQLGSDWMEDFPNDEERERWTHRLANLVLLSRYKNPAASNFDFKKKKEEYFADDGDAAYVLTSQVREHESWTPKILEARQKRLLGRIAEVWELS